MGWVERLATVAQRNPSMKLATHLCERRVNDVFKGDDTFSGGRSDHGLSTGPNQCDCTAKSRCVVALELRRQLCGSCTPTLTTRVSTSKQNPDTQSLSEGPLNLDTIESGCAGGLPPNASMLVDESKQTGALATPWPKASEVNYMMRYADGIRPDAIETDLKDIEQAGKGKGQTASVDWYEKSGAEWEE